MLGFKVAGFQLSVGFEAADDKHLKSNSKANTPKRYGFGPGLGQFRAQVF